MCLCPSARPVAIVFARSAGSEAMYCAGVLTFDGGFMDSSSSRTKCITERFGANQESIPGDMRVSRHLSIRCACLGLMAIGENRTTTRGLDLTGQVGFHQHGAAYQPMGMVQTTVQKGSPFGKDRSPPTGTYSFFLHEA